LALRGEEGRDKLRETAGIGKYELIRGYPNGATHPDADRDIQQWRQTWGTETSYYPQEKKTKVIPGVVASETG
jgi:hypothetical protein